MQGEGKAALRSAREASGPKGGGRALARRSGGTLLQRIPRPPRLPPWAVYAFALVVPVVTLWLQMFLLHQVYLVPFILFFLAVFLTSWLGGPKPGFVAIGLSAALANYYFLAPYRAFAVNPDALLMTGLFVLVSSTINLLSSSLREAFQVQDRLLREAREAVRVRDDFLSVAGHELKTPLTALQLQLESLQRLAARSGLTPREAAQLNERMEKLRDHIRRLDRLIHQLLDVSRLTSGALRLEYEELDLASVAREVVGRFSELARQSGSDIHLREEGASCFRWDRMRLEQVLSNLVGNAVKYGAGKPIEVSIGVVRDKALLRVEDQGIGIDVSHQQRIFDRFERAVSERHFGGLGLGLWIARQIIEAGGGRIRVDSVPGQGSTFTVELPLRPPAQGLAAGSPGGR